MLCGLVGLDSRLSKLLLPRKSVGVDCAFDDGRNMGDRSDRSPFTDLPSSERCSNSCSGSRDILLGERWMAEVSMVMVGARGLRPGPGEGDMRPPFGGGGSLLFDIADDVLKLRGSSYEPRTIHGVSFAFQRQCIGCRVNHLYGE